MEYLFYADVFFFGMAVLWGIHQHQNRMIAQAGYYKYIGSKIWKRRASACKKRFDNRCAVCNSPYRLEAHHRTYERLYHEKASDLTCLCDSCHELFSTNGKLFKR